MTLTRAAMLISRVGSQHYNMNHPADEVGVWRGKFRPGAAGTHLAFWPAQPTGTTWRAPGPTERQSAPDAAAPASLHQQFLLLQDPSARHLRDTCWSCWPHSRLAANHLLLQCELAVLSRPCIQAVFCALSRSRQQSEPATPSRLSDTNNPRIQRRPVDSRRPALQDAASSARFADVLPLRSLSPVRWDQPVESAQGGSTFLNSLPPVSLQQRLHRSPHVSQM
jgi:hypothetical protein